MMAISPEEQSRLDELRDMERFWLAVVGYSAAGLIVAVAALLIGGRA